MRRGAKRETRTEIKYAVQLGGFLRLPRPVTPPRFRCTPHNTAHPRSLPPCRQREKTDDAVGSSEGRLEAHPREHKTPPCTRDAKRPSLLCRPVVRSGSQRCLLALACPRESCTLLHLRGGSCSSHWFGGELRVDYVAVVVAVVALSLFLSRNNARVSLSSAAISLLSKIFGRR